VQPQIRLWTTPPEVLDSDVVVWVDVGKADRMWRNTEPDCYIGSGGTGHAIDNRYQLIGRELSAGKAVGMPLLSIDGPTLGFTDGRHRFAWCRDHGDCCLPVITPEESADELALLVGATCCGGSFRA
jgi:hypothetical protein